ASKGVRDGLIRPSGLPITIETEHTVVDQVRIVPRNGYYVAEVVYTRVPVQADVDPSFCVGIDLGVTNLAAIASNRRGFAPRLVNGRPLWKQECSMGRQNNQNFSSIPHARFIDILSYKAALVGIQVEVREESYTSQASFLDLDPIPTYTPDDE